MKEKFLLPLIFTKLYRFLILNDNSHLMVDGDTDYWVKLICGKLLSPFGEHNIGYPMLWTVHIPNIHLNLLLPLAFNVKCDDKKTQTTTKYWLSINGFFCLSLYNSGAKYSSSGSTPWIIINLIFSIIFNEYKTWWFLISNLYGNKTHSGLIKCLIQHDFLLLTSSFYFSYFTLSLILLMSFVCN